MSYHTLITGECIFWYIRAAYFWNHHCDADVTGVLSDCFKMPPKYKALFRDEWLKDEKFSDWLCQDKNSKHTARCSVCDYSFNVGTMGKSALTSHTTSKKHQESVQQRLRCVPVNALFQAPGSPKPRSPTLAKSVTKLEQLKAEVIWCLKVIDSHYSYNSSENVHRVFQLMFPDSNIAASFTCGATKRLLAVSHSGACLMCIY